MEKPIDISMDLQEMYFFSLSSNVYAEGITAADTVGKGVVGKFGEGFVDVPFTAWVEDTQFGEKRQLAVGFIERK